MQMREIGRETAGINRQSIQTQREKMVVNSCKSQRGIIGAAEEKEEIKRRQKKEDKEKEVNRKWRRQKLLTEARKSNKIERKSIKTRTNK